MIDIFNKMKINIDDCEKNIKENSIPKQIAQTINNIFNDRKKV